MLFEGCKCLNVRLKLVQKFPNFLSSLYKAFGIFGLFLKQYPLDDIPFLNFLTKLVTSKLICKLEKIPNFDFFVVLVSNGSERQKIGVKR